MEKAERAVEEVGEAGAGAVSEVRDGVKLVIATASFSSLLQNEIHPFVRSVLIAAPDGRASVWHGNSGKGVVEGYEDIYQKFRESSQVVCYMHDDAEIFETGWALGVEEMFNRDPKLAIAGLGGATGMGDRDIYKVPYEINQLVRVGYYSNQRGWEVHGKRETGVRDVAVVDGFFMAVRTSFLDQVGGWKWIRSNFHCYDTAMCLMALRHGWKVKILGIDCDHYGGGTSTKAEYIEWCRENGTTPEREHIEPHLWQYEEFRDVLPVRVE